MVVVPWKNGVSAVTPTPAPVQTASSSHGPGGREDVRIAVGEEPEPETPEPKSIPQAPQVVAEADLTANASPDAKLVEETYLKQLEARAKDEADTRAAEAEADANGAEPAASTESGAKEASSSSEAKPASEAEPVAEEPPRPSFQDRVVSAKHFETALGEIRPSSSEDGTLPELRKWAEQYGEGGKKQGKKSGFGKGFGFGELPIDKKKGFGRVVTDE